MNANQYAAALGLEGRYPLTSTMQGPESGLIADSVERDHGECAYYPLLWLMDSAAIGDAQRMLIWHAYTWLWFVAGAGALWLIARRLSLSRLLSGAAVLLLVFTPRMFAEGHYNNKDMVLFSLTLILLWLTLRLMEKPGIGRALLFSLAGAAAANTKILGLFLWGLCALTVLVRQMVGRRLTGRVWVAAFAALFGFAGFYLALTPALWPNPVGYLQYVWNNAAGFSRWDNHVLFRGEIYQLATTSLPRWYLPYMILATTPLWALALLTFGQGAALIALLRKARTPRQTERKLALLLCTLLWVLPLGYAVFTGATVYNGWRHFYFLYGPMLVLAAYGLGVIARRLEKNGLRTAARVGATLLALCLAMTGTLMALAHPNEYVYYNQLLLQRNVPEYLELDYWNVSVLQTLRNWVRKVDATQPVTIAGAELWSQIGLEANVKLLTPEEQAKLRVFPQGDEKAEYLLSNRTYAVLGHWQPGAAMSPAMQVQAFGWPLCTVYARTAP